MTQKISDRIKIERTRLGFSVNELAELLERSDSSQIKIESGIRRPSSDYLLKVSVLGMDVSYIITGQRSLYTQKCVSSVEKQLDLNDFHERLKRYRHLLGLSQTAFAKIAGVKYRTQQTYETVERQPDVKYLINLYNAGIDIDYLLKGQSNPTNPTVQALATAFFEADSETQKVICEALGLDLTYSEPVDQAEVKTELIK